MQLSRTSLTAFKPVDLKLSDLPLTQSAASRPLLLCRPNEPIWKCYGRSRKVGKVRNVLLKQFIKSNDNFIFTEQIKTVPQRGLQVASSSESFSVLLGLIEMQNI